MKVYALIFTFLVLLNSILGKPFAPTSKPELAPKTKETSAETIYTSDEIPTSTGPPWLRFLKKKKTTTTTSPSVEDFVNSMKFDSKPKTSKKSKPVHNTETIRAVPAGAAPPTAVSSYSTNDILNWLAVYFQPSQLQYGTAPTDILSQDRKTNPDSLYDEVYLDWMKREIGSSEPESQILPAYTDAALLVPNTPEVQSVQPVPIAPVQQQQYAYPTVPLMYNPFFPLGGMKMQKVMVQAQMDAAMAALNITTTPKPIKLKLKISVPGNIDLTQLSQITTGLSNSLPPGSTYELA